MGEKFVNKVKISALLLALTSLTIFGCGKNVVGPTAPQAKSSQALDAVQQSTIVSGTNEDANSLQAACSGKKRKYTRWSHRKFNAYLLKFNPWSVKKFGNVLCNGYFTDPEVKRTVRRILRCRLFYIITFRCGLGPYLFKACLRVLMQSWFPGPGTCPNGFDDPEVTLFPYAWNRHRGFYGEFNLGWHNGVQYFFESYNSDTDGDRTTVCTYTGDGDIYQNQNNINQFTWDFSYVPHENGDDSSIRFTIGYFYNKQKLMIMDKTKIKEAYLNTINFPEVWASTQDKSGCCEISSTNGELNMLLNFKPSGKGKGYLEIINRRGNMDTYNFTVWKGGRHGYWTKNGGRKRYF